MRKDPVLHAREKDDGELQAFSRVKGHQGDDSPVIVVVRDLVGIGDQGDLFEKLHQCRVFVCCGELLGHRFEFREVLDPCFVLRIVRLLKFENVSSLLKDRLKDGGRISPRLTQGAQRIHDLHEPLNGVQRPGCQSGSFLGAMQSLIERDALTFGQHLNRRLSAIADASLGHVQNSAQRHLIAWIGDGSQIRESVANFAPFVEANTTHNFVGHAHADENLLDGPGLSIGSIEHRDITGTVSVLVHESVDLLANERGFIVFVVADVADDGLTRPLVGPQSLLASCRVVGNHRVRGAEDVLSRAIVLLEKDRRGARKVPLELLDISDCCATEGVDGLICIADDAQACRRQPGIALRSDEFTNQDVLGVIGVLVFVYENVSEASSVVLGDIGEEL